VYFIVNLINKKMKPYEIKTVKKQCSMSMMNDF
jgi:hypothetical protein